MLRRRLMMLVQGLYRWISSKRKTSMTRSHTADTAPGVSTEAARVLLSRRKIEGEARPVRDVLQERQVVILRDHSPAQTTTIGASMGRKMCSWMTNLEAYKVAPFIVLQKIVMRRDTEAEVAPGRDAVSPRKAVFKHKLAPDGSAGRDAEVERETVLLRDHDVEAVGSAFEDAKKNAVLLRDHKADASLARREDAQRYMVAEVLVSGATWIDPELLEGGILYIRQSHSTKQSDNTLEVS